MDCKTVAGHLDAYLEERLPIDVVYALEAHSAHCSNCQNKLIIERRFRELLDDLHTPGASTPFARKALGPNKRRHLVTLGWALSGSFVGTLVAIFAFWILIGEPQNFNRPTVRMSVNQTQTVHLVFESDNAMVQSTLSLSLPPNMELEGYPGQRHFNWPVTLKKGKNQLSLPIVASNRQPGELVARIVSSDSEKVFRVKLEPGNWRGGLTSWMSVS